MSSGVIVISEPNSARYENGSATSRTRPWSPIVSATICPSGVTPNETSTMCPPDWDGIRPNSHGFRVGFGSLKMLRGSLLRANRGLRSREHFTQLEVGDRQFDLPATHRHVGVHTLDQLLEVTPTKFDAVLRPRWPIQPQYIADDASPSSVALTADPPARCVAVAVITAIA